MSESDHIQGSQNAPITLVEYGDYECSYCGEAYPLIKNAQAQLGNRLRFVFRNFPLTQVHPHAAQAAEAAENAAAQGKFWEMHDLLYENQQNLADEDLMSYAAKLSLDEGKFADALQSGMSENKVQADFTSGVESGVNGTPAFFINGVRFDGNWEGNGLLNELQRH